MLLKTRSFLSSDQRVQRTRPWRTPDSKDSTEALKCYPLLPVELLLKGGVGSRSGKFVDNMGDPLPRLLATPHS